ncbi:hypothetical protein Verru16b_01434 [Lacunisphaera limnophila]|uniref:DUF5069 domain-containing protein n=1 Tax=Lacunisphaera limnophila TaxID=1838286 RepID=A0A1D8AU09_9BACT|nr:DUF5069 domain-containing protein [Lacunisphaera limnophila]AOS44372.1 hypothetical protein Verru16b_01434 [Lacunisphaera limnophila]
MQKLRRPSDKLAGCVWLPRFIDKTRYYLAGTLEPDFVLPYCHPVATDGAFLKHFGIQKQEIIEVIRLSSGSDAPVGEWFQGRSACSANHVEAWNALAPNLGRPGFPVHRGFQFLLKTYYGGDIPDPRVDSVFTVIAFDEGYLEELTPRDSLKSMQ